MNDGCKHWTAMAACLGKDPAMFHPQPGLGRGDFLYRAGKAVCAGCPVRGECLCEAMAVEGLSGLRAGLWGGLTPDERDHLARQVQRLAG